MASPVNSRLRTLLITKGRTRKLFCDWHNNLLQRLPIVCTSIPTSLSENTQSTRFSAFLADTLGPAPQMTD